MSKLLYLNLAMDSDDTSLGFAVGWLEEISKNYEAVDVITLRLGKLPNLDKKITVHGPTPKLSKLYKYKFLHKTAKELIKKTNYENCFSHMSPISVFTIAFLLKKNNIKSTLWFTHPGPKFGLKKIILYIAFKLSDKILTASPTSFPFKSNKVHVIGHSINQDKFINQKSKYKLSNFLILSRISKSKNLEIGIDAFLNSDVGEKKLDIIGGTLNQDDEQYLSKLKLKYAEYNNIKFLGKINHTALPNILQKYDINFNCAGDGFFDKTVLETLSMGIVNFYRNSDFNSIYKDYSHYYFFENSTDLTEKINLLGNVKEDELIEFFHSISHNLKNHSLSSLNERLGHFI